MKKSFNKEELTIMSFYNCDDRIKLINQLESVVENVLLFLIYQFLVGIVDTFTKYLHTDLAVACAHLVDEGFQMVMQIAIAFVVLAGADVFYQWWDYERQLRMSKQEIKEEYKQMEGDPQVKGKIKEVQRRMAQSRMMQQVPKAQSFVLLSPYCSLVSCAIFGRMQPKIAHETSEQ